MEATREIPNVGIAATTDIADNLGNIHPWDKWDVGHRLALIALARDYGRKNIEYSGPVYKKVTAQAGSLVVTFDHAEGLKSRDGKPLNDFEIAGSNGNFVPATAHADGETVIVSSPEVKVPKWVRMGWHETANPNLENSAGLPALPFQAELLGGR